MIINGMTLFKEKHSPNGILVLRGIHAAMYNPPPNLPH